MRCIFKMHLSDDGSVARLKPRLPYMHSNIASVHHYPTIPANDASKQFVYVNRLPKNINRFIIFFFIFRACMRKDEVQRFVRNAILVSASIGTREHTFVLLVKTTRAISRVDLCRLAVAMHRMADATRVGVCVCLCESANNVSNRASPMHNSGSSSSKRVYFR